MKTRAFLFATFVATGFVSTCVAPTAVLAQSAGSISGTVTDGAGQALGNARIRLSGPVSTEAVTKPDGTYSVSVPPGIYSVTISASGFQSTRQDNIAIVPGQTVSLKTSLANASLTTIGHTSTSATAVSSAPVLQQSVNASALLNQGQDQVVNVLDQIPGVEILRVGGGSNEPGSNASISLRGAEPYESQILIDGHPVNTAGNGTFGFNTAFINSLLISNIEVSEGPGSMTNTVEDAVGGTLNFRTAPITAKPTSAFQTGYDSFDTFTYALRFSDTIGKVGFLVGAARETTPGFLTPQYLWGADNYYNPVGIPVYPNPRDVFGPGASYDGVLNFRYPATSDFSSDSQLVKLSYSFSPVTSMQFSSYSTQTWLDETGNNEGSINALIVPCIYTGATPSATCPAGGTAGNYNYTANPFLGYVGTHQLINYYAAYPNTYEFDNEPLYTGEFRTVIGPGSLLARYYAGSVSRTVTQNEAPYAISPCYTPTCQWVVTDTPPLPGKASSYDDNGYPGEPYIEPTTDTLHGFDAQYTLPIGANTITVGFDRHVDKSLFINGVYAVGYWPYDTTPSDYYTLESGTDTYFTVASTSESVRGSFQLLPDLQLDAGAYFSNTSYVGSRFDPRAGLTFRPNANTSVRASWGSAYVAPYYGLVTGTTEKITGGSLIVPTTTFNPETSTGWDIGGDYKYGRDSLVSLDLYDSTIYNRYAQIVEPVSGTFDGKPYSSETINSSQGDGRQAGVELSLVHQPRVGFGYRAMVDLLRDYSYNQVPSKSGTLFFELPADGVQLPGYPDSKMRGDLFYTFPSGSSVRFSSTTYGANNAFGQPGFTEFDAALKFPTRAFDITLGARNLFDKDGNQVGGIYYGGYTSEALGGGVGPTNLEYVQPRTVYLELSRQTGF
ncbi:MAG TPA: TonB-dependent receptor [Candidatus Sulfotelmatobacter sp.]|nr:TonB-dependent receptor [Candidatus Sulfotelmatobacter sp.]